MKCQYAEMQNFYPRPPRGGRHAARPRTKCAQVISIHALREEGDLPLRQDPDPVCDFYPRPPRGGRPPGGCKTKGMDTISIHALREEGDAANAAFRSLFAEFLSTPSARRATQSWATLRHGRRKDFYPRPPRGGRQPYQLRRAQGGRISIHALREEGDYELRRENRQYKRFLSTPSARRATAVRRRVGAEHRNFYPRPPRGGRLSIYNSAREVPKISIHALREEGDCSRSTPTATTMNFYPRPPRGGRRYNRFHRFPDSKISIHALREEGDQKQGTGTDDSPYFYPRPPRGGRPISEYNNAGFVFISIHALREEGDDSPVLQAASSFQFLSTPSARRATMQYSHSRIGVFISIHALREEGDRGR